MPLFTDTFSGADGTLLAGRTGWVSTSGYYDVLRLNGTGGVKFDTYTDDPKSALNDTGSADHYVQATVGAGFKTVPGNKLILGLAASDRNNFAGVSFDTVDGILRVRSGSANVEGITGQGIDAGDVLRLEWTSSTDTLVVKKNGATIATVVVSGYFTEGTKTGIFLSYNGTTATDDIFRDWESNAIGGAPADTTAPTLTSARASATSGTTASGSVTTDEANGTLYWLTNTSSTATATAVKAGSSQAVTATGAQSTNSTGLSPGTTYYTHYLHRDTAGNDSAVLSSASFATPAPDTTAPTFTGSITVGAKTSSTIAMTLPTATDNVAVTGYEYRVDGGAWVDNGNSTAVALSGLSALTSYTVDARAYDAAANVSSTLSVTTSTYRAGASAGSIRTATGPQDGNPAGLLYAFCELRPTSDWVSYSIVSGPTPSGGTLDAQPNGAFSYVGPEPATLTIQPEVNGVASGDQIVVTLYDSSVPTGAGSDTAAASDTVAATMATTYAANVSETAYTADAQAGISFTPPAYTGGAQARISLRIGLGL